MHVDLLLLPGAFQTQIAVTIDGFATANRLLAELSPESPPPLSWSVRTRDGKPVAASNGQPVVADGPWEDARGDIALPFGVGMPDESLITCGRASPHYGRLVEFLRERHAAGARLAGSCASTFALAETGLLDNGRATTSWWLGPLFRRTFPAVTLDPDALLTEHNRVTCAGAALAQFDLVLYLISQQAGELARVCAKYFVLDGGRRSQAPYIIPEHLARHDPLVADAQDWIRRHLVSSFSIADLAQHLGCSSRTLNRRFVRALGHAPSVYIQRCRAEEAARLLRSTDASISEVAARVGYAEEGALRKSFQRTFHSSPLSYRQRYRPGR
ncbi:MAG: helix-turn-helix domain-containing protein [Myxococcota bacterium]